MSNKKILVADDDYEFNKLICRILEKAGFEVISAFDGEQAILFAMSSKPDLILLDINMPRKGGDIVYGDLKIIAGTHNAPILIMSGAPPEEIINLAEKRGIRKEDVFIKPFNYDKFIEKINSYLSE